MTDFFSFFQLYGACQYLAARCHVSIYINATNFFYIIHDAIYKKMLLLFVMDNLWNGFYMVNVNIANSSIFIGS